MKGSAGHTTEIQFGEQPPVERPSEEQESYFAQLRSREAKLSRVYQSTRCFFGQPELLGKETLHISDLRVLESCQDISAVESEVAECYKKFFFEIMENLSKAVDPIAENPCLFFGMYDHIIKKIVRKDAIKLRVYEILFGIFLIGFVTLQMYSVRLVLNRLYSTEAFLAWISLVFVAFLIIAFYYSGTVHGLEERIKLKARQALTVFIHKKLNSSDSYFLEHSDNNMIYKLLYLEFEDYIKYAHNTVGLWIFAAVFILSAWVPFILPNSIGYGFSAICITRVAAALVLTAVRIRQVRLQKIVHFEIRKNLHEFVQNFKAFSLKNLKHRVAVITKELLAIKSSTTQKVNLLSELQMMLTRLCTFAYLVSLLIHLGKTSADGEREMSESVFNQSGLSRLQVFPSANEAKLLQSKLDPVLVLLPLCLVLFILDYFINRGAAVVSDYFAYKLVLSIYDKFLFNDLINVKRPVAADSPMDSGDIELVNCSVSERVWKSITHVLNYILHKGEDTLPSLGTLNVFKTKIRGQMLLNSAHDSSIRSPEKRLSRYQIHKSFKLSLMPTKQMTSNLKLLLANLNMKISGGSKVCLFDNGRRKSLSAFVNLLINESIVSEGAARIPSRISYFNPRKMHFIAGKTIRDNIIYNEKYDLERYEQILKVLNLNFGNYSGYDFYQIAEKGENLRNEDKINILLANFLYRDADVYIIEDYFSHLNISLVLEKFRVVFQGWLKSKTVFFDSNDLQVIKLSQNVISFVRNRGAVIRPTLDFIKDITSGVLVESITDTSRPRQNRVQIFQNKIKNSVFVQNVSYEEELMIHKKKEAARKEIENLKRTNPSTMELLSYGIYLTNKRRQEGVNLEEPLDMKPSIVWKEIKRIMRQSSVKKPLVYLVFIYAVSSIISCIIETYVAHYLSTAISNAAVFRSKYWTCIGLCIVGLLFEVCWFILLQRFLSKSLLELNNKILSSILNSGIRGILTKKSHRILDKIGNDVMQIESNLLHLINSHLYSFVNCLVLMLVQSLIHSFVIPIILFVGVILSFSRLLQLVLPISMKVQKLVFEVSEKSKALHYQLVRLIPQMRISGVLGELENRQNIHSNHRALCRVLSDGMFHRFLHILCQAVGVFWLAIFLLEHFLTSKFASVVLFKMFSEGVVHWSYLNWFRISGFFFALPSCHKLLLETLVCGYSINKYLRSSAQEAEQRGTSKKVIRPVYDFSAPIIFKNVSITLGYQPVLKKVSFRFEAAELVGIYGFDGGGRSTIFELIFGLIKRDSQQRSTISLFGQHIEDVEEEVLKKEVFLIEKDPVLLEGRIKDNIDPYGEIELEQLKGMLIDLNFAEIFKGGRIYSSDQILREISLHKNIFDSIKPEKGSDFANNFKRSFFSMTPILPCNHRSCSRLKLTSAV